ncbi:MAG: hypothetical protein JWR78_221 [Mycobacterium sp.]|nr:hypothetical protein [Mycobacterium sp.]
MAPHVCQRGQAVQSFDAIPVASGGQTSSTGREVVNQPGQVLPLATSAYTSWVARVLASMIDAIPLVVLFGIGVGIELGTRTTLCAGNTTEYDIAPFCATGNTTAGVVALLVSFAIGVVYLLWNYGFRQGRTGSSLGKTVMKFEVVSERTGQPIGFGMSVVRQFAHALDSLVCNVGYLFPLWDAKRRTIADMVMKTVCLPKQ